MNGYVGNIEEETLKNDFFRSVLYTGQHSQLVVMSLLPSEDIGLETHDIVDQFIRVEKGEGVVILDGVTKNIKDGDAILVPAGASHNIINSSKENSLKLYTIYSPPHHKDKTVHKTKAEAQMDEEDHI